MSTKTRIYLDIPEDNTIVNSVLNVIRTAPCEIVTVVDQETYVVQYAGAHRTIRNIEWEQRFTFGDFSRPHGTLESAALVDTRTSFVQIPFHFGITFRYFILELLVTPSGKLVE